ncbi:hypothetical protein Poli38472_009777 [Pythium oligandrum]|uniref:Uncharacterized protein n=1 Tax=Pythium oligandrum TaxID=41045 RepID=A0A8K1CFW1_PYTOL|nr:hypothetical protein Poli38472_009777 [Pythium oligandrum]|eukprot:TMW62284.1 hypothetical protein Poli38472_009777 [Pythium oligandrum]
MRTAFSTINSLLVAAATVGLPSLSGVDAAGTQLVVNTVYHSATCEGKVVQNDYLVAPNGKCTESTTCAPWPSGASSSYTVGCCTMDIASFDAYTKTTFGLDVNTVSVVLYSDKSCKSITLAVDSLVTTSVETARCNPLIDGTSSMQFTYNSTDFSVTSWSFASKDCTGTVTNTTFKTTDFGKCITTGSTSIQAYSTIDNVNYGLPVDGSATVTLGLASLVVSLIAGFFAHF